MWENPTVNSFFLNVALCAIGINIAILVYITVYLPFKTGRNDIDPSVDTPQLVPAMTVAGLAGFICFNLAVWPIFGFLTPFYLIIMFFGGSLTMTFLPGGSLGTLMFWILFFGIGYVSHTLPHDPVWHAMRKL